MVLCSGMAHGKLIVIDGGDGAGKKTQTKLLIEKLSADGLAVETVDFPQYGHNFFGGFIKECLIGTHGDFLNVDPHIASVVYAADRFESRDKIKDWLEAGKHVVIDRYVSSNMLHQGGKISDRDKREAFLKWLDTMEHEVFGAPRPDLIIYCSLDPKKRMELLEAEAAATGVPTDIPEQDLAHQEAADAVAEQVASMNNWRTVECAPDGELRRPEDIHEEIYQIVKSIL